MAVKLLPCVAKCFAKGVGSAERAGSRGKG